MARRRYRRYRRRTGRWAGNIKTINYQTLSAPPGSFSGVIDLATNPVQSDSTVTQTYTIKNIELTYQIDYIPSTIDYNIEALCAYIMYVPEGYIVTETLPNLHPEWIMAYRWLGEPDIDGTQPGRLPSKIKTRMARRLQSGDKVVLLITGSNRSSSNTYNLQVSGLLRWWTKAN